VRRVGRHHQRPVNPDPTQNFKVVEDEEKLSFIMKNGKIFKNTL
jgi:hypothetical protein